MITFRLQSTYAALFAALVMLSSCSRGPSDDSIKTAITDHLKHEVPISWSGSLMGGTNSRIEIIEIKQRGRFNKESNYWPIKAHVKGTCEVNLLVRTETKAFDKVGDFQLSQDDYGNWKAAIEMMQ